MKNKENNKNYLELEKKEYISDIKKEKSLSQKLPPFVNPRVNVEEDKPNYNTIPYSFLMHQTQSLSIYQHVPWYTFQSIHVSNSKSTSYDNNNSYSFQMVSTTESESGISQNIKKLNTKNDASPSFKSSLPSNSLKLSNNIKKRQNHTLQNKYIFEPEQLKSQLAILLRDRENEFSFH
ncbi:hypothetical protein BCR36DRAFT_121545 [Piromyces finnis]|uniref:Uncharacterized protein n=1 Tax=Piromyces finnis TaxID=1754191 RepID=A0A1Y1V202_9FUNG|nr:hypothetical protein BCR36DRAFT_121545 [Piromyces finnis]|eukprot:ORX44828.1 hypothetical protein BCR36DRAFT_121545 [Piromyces finnis]